jgi:hypothetical protein
MRTPILCRHQPTNMQQPANGRGHQSYVGTNLQMNEDTNPL